METNARRVDLDGVEHHWLDRSGVRLHVVTAGAGPNLVLLHGFPESWWEYRDVIGSLAQHHRVICPDMRGSGDSDAPPSGYDGPTLTADLLDILDHFGVERAGFVAHDWGAVLSFGLALDHPTRVEWLLAMSVPHPWTRMSASMLWAFRHSWYLPLVLTPGLGPWLLRAGKQRFQKHLFRTFTADPNAWTDEVIEPYLAAMREPARARAGHLLYRDYILPAGMELTRGRREGYAMPCPTLLLTGVHDPVVRAEFVAGDAAQAAGVQVEEVTGAGHWMVEERPDVVIARALALGAGERAHDS
ncbi:alpha/beta hydrolase [Knoellia sp. S7-12]|uniref:alpha/beta fold hydrolase n=1 Tax=Knoellia sp. S7-12 TaxID=3126698 RepID=UPI003368A2BF